tara:strand:- start:41 stop:403 length:363 start_codon:yes stop_codon:yes gene_type:complete
MAVYVANLVINQGSDFYQTFNLANTQGDSAFDLTGYSIAAKIKKHPAATDYYSTSFTATIENATNGLISLALTDTQTRALKAGRQVYDVVIAKTSSPYERTRVIEGSALVREGVTYGYSP